MNLSRVNRALYRGGLIFAITFFNPLISNAATAVEKCVKNPNRQACWIFSSRYGHVPVYEAPDVLSPLVSYPPTGHLGLGDAIRIDWKKTKTGPRGWVYYKQQSVREIDPKEMGWVESKNVAGNEDFRRVAGCWPIEFFKDGADGRLGDFELTAHMDTKGRFQSEEADDGHVWFAENLVLFGRPGKAVAIYGFDPATRKLYQPSGGGYYVEQVRYFSNEKLQGCEGGLKLQKRK
jgi:hypothetical protein